MTLQERVAALGGMGFSERQSQFLTLVALHSGFCLRRQYATFTGLHYGKNVRDFLDGLVDRRLARRFTYRADAGHIYHLNARSLYRAIRQEDNRNRRHTGPALIARKLMLLDFVLMTPQREWYATEEEKVDLFTQRFHVPHAALPQRTYSGSTRPNGTRFSTTRYCVQKLPVFLSGTPPQVHFLCLVTEPRAKEIENFMREHSLLLRHLPAWTLVVTGPDRIATEAHCADCFASASASSGIPTALTSADLSWLFQTRRTIESGTLSALSVAELRRYRQARSQWSKRLEAVYARWLEGGPVARNQQASMRECHCPGQLVVQWLPHLYKQVGSFPGTS